MEVLSRLFIARAVRPSLQFCSDMAFTMSRFSREQKNAVTLVVVLNALTIVSSLFKVDATAVSLLISPLQSIIHVVKQTMYMLVYCLVELIILSTLWILFLTSNSTSAIVNGIKARWMRLRQVFRYIVTGTLMCSIYTNWSFRVIFVSHVTARALLQVVASNGSGGRAAASASSSKKGQMPRAASRGRGELPRSPVRSFSATPRIAGAINSPLTSERVTNVAMVSHSYQHREQGSGATPKTPALTRRLFRDEATPHPPTRALPADDASPLVDRLPTLFNPNPNPSLTRALPKNNWFAAAKASSFEEEATGAGADSGGDVGLGSALGDASSSHDFKDPLDEGRIRALPYSQADDAVDESMDVSTVMEIDAPSSSRLGRGRARVSFAADTTAAGDEAGGAREGAKRRKNTPGKPAAAAPPAAAAAPQMKQALALFPLGAGTVKTAAATVKVVSKRKLHSSLRGSTGDDEIDEEEEDVFENRKKNMERLQTERNKIVESLIDSTLRGAVTNPSPFPEARQSAAPLTTAGSDVATFTFSEPTPSFSLSHQTSFSGRPPVSPPKSHFAVAAPGIAFSFPSVDTSSSSSAATSATSAAFHFPTPTVAAAGGSAFLFASSDLAGPKSDRKKGKSKKK